MYDGEKTGLFIHAEINEILSMLQANSCSLSSSTKNTNRKMLLMACSVSQAMLASASPLYVLKWVPGKVLESKGSQQSIYHVTDQVPIDV